MQRSHFAIWLTTYTAMQLYSRILGHGPPIVILHGLFGMSDNWLTIGKALAGTGYTIHLPDLRNHGKSPHAETHGYPDMCDDLLQYIEENRLNKVDIIGHSMGGKLAMVFALLHPERVRKLVVVDIAPSDYRNPDNTFHTHLINILLQIDLSAHRERGAIRQELETMLHDRQLAMFLTKNIGKDEQRKTFKWKFNLPVINKHIQQLKIGLAELKIHAPCPVPTLFIKGNNSEYYQPQHEQDRLFFFPDSKVVGVNGAGHWVHSEQTDIFLKAVSAFLTDS